MTVLAHRALFADHERRRPTRVRQVVHHPLRAGEDLPGFLEQGLAVVEARAG